jgi:hypothetical protein
MTGIMRPHQDVKAKGTPGAAQNGMAKDTGAPGGGLQAGD